MNTSALKRKDPVLSPSQNKNFSHYLKPIAAAAVGFSLSQLNSLGDISPFSVSFVSALPFDYCFAAFIGSAVGYFVSRPWQTALKYVFALLVAAVFRLVVLRKLGSADKPFACGVVACCAALCSGSAFLALTEFSFSSVISLCAEAAISLISVLILMRSLKIPVLSIGIKKLSTQDMLCLAYCMCAFLMSLSGHTFGSVSPARIAASIAVIFISQYKGASAASAAGICAGFAFCLPQELRFMFALYALSGLISGFFSPLGQYTCAFSFAVTACVVTIVNGLDNFVFFPLAEAVIAATAYAVIPPRLITSLQDKIEESGFIKDEHIDRQVCQSLKSAAQKVGEVSEIVTKVSEKLDKVINPEINKVFAKMQQNVCYGCGKKSECWNRYFSETAADIMVIAGIREGNSIKTRLEHRCVKPNALVREIGKYYPDFVSGMASKMKVSEMRNIVSDQFAGISEFLNEIAFQAENSRIEESAKSRSILTALRDSGTEAESLHCYTNPGARTTVEITLFEDAAEIDFEKITAVLEISTGKKFERPEIDVTPTGTTVRFNERPVFKVQFGYSQIPLAQNKVCGDCVGHTRNLQGCEIALISDGMGTGSRAAIDATMTATLMEKLLSCGFSFESAVKMVNSALIVKSTDESLATVDAVSINVYSGTASFHKAGAAISFIRSKDSIRIINEPSMPIGIIRSICPANRKEKLEAGDIVMLVSDGVTAGDCGWINDELLAWSTNSMDDLASHIASLAKLRYDENTADDITVVTAKIMRNI